LGCIKKDDVFLLTRGKAGKIVSPAMFYKLTGVFFGRFTTSCKRKSRIKLYPAQFIKTKTK